MKELTRIVALQNILKGSHPIETERQENLDKKFRLEFNYNSNHIEGNTLTYSETKLLLIFDDAKGDHTLREFEEMKGSDVAFQLIHEWALDYNRPLSEQGIRNLNEILLVRPFWKEAITNDGQRTRRQIKVGQYKEHPNSVLLQNGEMFHYASPIDTPIQMKELIEWFRGEEEKKELDPVILAALLHYKFVLIHPFDDGNGRISRLLMNYVLLRNSLPPIIIKSEDKRNYLTALNRADAGDIEGFTQYIAEQLIWSLEISIKAARGENIDEPGDLDKKIKLLKQKLNSSDEVVKIIKSKGSILESLNKNIEPLFKRISEKLGQFDSLFKSKREYLNNEQGELGTNLEISLRNLKTQLQMKLPSHIFYVYELSDFRKGSTAFTLNCSLVIEFHLNVYEIKSQYVKFNFSKLYHENLTDYEMEEITEELGANIFERIEQSIVS